MDSKHKLCRAIINEGGVRPEDLDLARIHWHEDGESWRVSLKRDVSFIWGGVERTLPAGTALGEVFIDFMDGETAEAVPYMFIVRPEWYIYPVEQLEREMADAE